MILLAKANIIIQQGEALKSKDIQLDQFVMELDSLKMKSDDLAKKLTD